MNPQKVTENPRPDGTLCVDVWRRVASAGPLGASGSASAASAFYLRSPAFMKVSIQDSTSDCLRSCCRQASTSLRSPLISDSSSSTFRFADHR